MGKKPLSLIRGFQMFLESSTMPWEKSVMESMNLTLGISKLRILAPFTIFERLGTCWLYSSSSMKYPSYPPQSLFQHLLDWLYCEPIEGILVYNVHL